MNRPRKRARKTAVAANAPSTAPRRRSRQRDAVLEVLERSSGPLSPAEIHARALRRAPTIGLSTVYRIVRGLAEEGAVSAVTLPGQPARYEPAAVADTHHHHFHCERCGRVFDIAGCPAGLERLLPPAFTLERHDIVLYGSCAECG
ncbi:MAG: transcriptional repressor [Phycisphaerales bacterium]|nr:transcriptional repressor [Phycisphaerales bacterium]